MKRPRKADESAVHAAHKLPADETMSVAGSGAYVRELTSGLEPGSGKARLVFESSEAAEWLTEAAESRFSRSPAAHVLGANDQGAALSDRVCHLILQEAVQFRQFGADSLGVVVQPDHETRLFLQLTRRDGFVEARARWESGSVEDAGSLWAALQQSLARQQIRLMPLKEQAPEEATVGFDEASQQPPVPERGEPNQRPEVRRPDA